jgi:hypothetical protein
MRYPVFLIVLFTVITTGLSAQIWYHPSKIVRVEYDQGNERIIENRGQDSITRPMNSSFEYFYQVFAEPLTDQQLRQTYLYMVFSNRDNIRVAGRKLSFLDSFRVIAIDTDSRRVTLSDISGSTFLVSFAELDESFIWQNQMVDSERMYMPFIGFTSVEERIEIDKLATRRGPSYDYEPYVEKDVLNYDAYKILDYKDGFYLLADLGDLNYNVRKGEEGVLGWIPAEFVVTWIGRRYQKIRDGRAESYFENLKDANNNPVDDDTLHLLRELYCNTENYIAEKFPSIKAQSGDHVAEHKKLFIDFYQRSGSFYSGLATRSRGFTTRRVTLFSNYSHQIAYYIANQVRSNIRVHFLIDHSTSIIPFAPFCEVFISEFHKDPFFPGNSLWENFFSYLEKESHTPNIRKHSSFSNIRYGGEQGDLTYTENLLPSLRDLINRIDDDSHHLIRTIFVVTDAGDNDHYFNNKESVLNEIISEAEKKGINIIFIIPDQETMSTRTSASHMRDTQQSAYQDLLSIIRKMERRLNTSPEHKVIQTMTVYERAVAEYSRRYALDIIDTYKRGIKGLYRYDPDDASDRVVINPKILELLVGSPQARDRNLSVYRRFHYVGSENYYEDRVAISQDLFNTLSTLANSRRHQANFNETVKRGIIINNLYGISDFDRIEEEWRKLERRFRQFNEDIPFTDTALYNALTGDSVWGVSINRNLSSILTNLEVKDRSFSFNVSHTSDSDRGGGGLSNYVFLKVSELFEF